MARPVRSAAGEGNGDRWQVAAGSYTSGRGRDGQGRAPGLPLLSAPVSHLLLELPLASPLSPASVVISQNPDHLGQAWGDSGQGPLL